MLFSNMDFNFAHFANFNYAHFEIEDRFGSIWMKFKMIDWVFRRCSFLTMGFIFTPFVYKESFGKIWVEMTE